MAKKNDVQGIVALVALASVILSSVFLINTVAVNKHFTKKYNLDEVDVRVHDSGNILRFFKFMYGIGLLMIFSLILVQYPIEYGIDMIRNGVNSANLIGVIVPIALIAISIIICFTLSARIGTSQIGMLVFPDKDKFVIPADPNRNTLVENIFQGKLFSDMYKMEELPLSEIQKITRESGKKAYVHGKFGTRRISWRDKQKRDECIATLERACKKNLGGYDRGY